MTNQERRRYFRVDDEVALTLVALSEDYGGETVDKSAELNEQVHASLEIQLRQALADVRIKSPDIAHALDLINQKINLIHNHEVASDLTPVVKPVSLSACGIAFTWHESIGVGEQVLLHLFLLPMHHLVKTEAQVVALEPNPDPQSSEPFILRLDFVGITPMYQEMLIQHVVQRQSVHLRRRSGLDSSEEDDA